VQAALVVAGRLGEVCLGSSGDGFLCETVFGWCENWCLDWIGLGFLCSAGVGVSPSTGALILVLVFVRVKLVQPAKATLSFCPQSHLLPQYLHSLSALPTW